MKLTLKRIRTSARREEGVALLTVLGLMLVFVMLGAAYVRYMSIEVDGARYELLDMRSEHLASGGAYAAIGEIQKAIATGGAVKSEYAISLPAYRFEGGERSPYPQTVTVRVMDESSRVNLNHAPAELLMALGLTEAHVKALRKSIGKGKSARWLVNVDELRTRDIMDGQEFGDLNKDLFTVFTAGNPAEPNAYINLNTVNETILAAIFNIDAVEAKTLAAQRPFASWEDAVAKLGREPATFNISNIDYAARTMPPEFSLSTRCYRIVSEVAMVVEPGTSSNGLHRAVEAVVIFDGIGNESIRYWNEHPTDEAYTAEAVEVPVEAEASETNTEAPATE